MSTTAAPVGGGAGYEATAADFLRSVSLFAGLPARLIAEIAARSSQLALRGGEWLFRKGDSGDALYVVRSGRLEVFSDGPDDDPLRVLLRGSVVGELALLTGAPRSASVRARRDSALLELGRRDFIALLDEPGFALELLRILGSRLRESRALAPPEGVPVTIAIVPFDPAVDNRDFCDRLAGTLAKSRRVARISAPDGSLDAPDEAVIAAMLDRQERAHDHVLLEGVTPADSPWNDFCIRQADRIVCLAAGGGVPAGLRRAGLRGCDLVFAAPRFGRMETAPLVEAVDPRASCTLRPGPTYTEGVSRLARRLAGSSVGVVLSGGGARGLAHVGVLEELTAAGIEIDRIGGCSMGAFIGGMFAMGLDPGAIRDRCTAELLRRNPLGDYTLPVFSLVRGRRGLEMLERVFGSTRIEHLEREFFAVSCDLVSGELVVHRQGRLADAIAASMSLPGILPPMPLEGRLLVDGGVLDNLPVQEMTSSGQGPVIAVDVSAQFGGPGVNHERPRLKEVLVRAISLGGVDALNAARGAADVLITPEVGGVGMLDFRQLERMIDAGRKAARDALRGVNGDLVDASGSAARPRTA